MQVKRYEVTNVQEALGRIKSDLGPEAIVLSTKTLRNSPPRLIEVIAAVDRNGPVGMTTGEGRGKGKEERDKESLADGIADCRRQIEEMKDMMAAIQRGLRVQEDLAELRDGVSALFNVLGLGVKYRDRDEVAKLYYALVRNGVSKTRTAKIVADIQKDPRFFKARNYEEITAVAEQCLAESLRRRRADGGGGRLKALVGPTGVGKTTTLAKLAARCRIDEGKRAGLITTDTYRIAAVEQLKIYAKILEVPVYVAADKDAFRKSVQALADRDVILIDTPGKSPRDAAHLQHLQEMFSTQESLDVLLLLSTTAGRDSLLETADRYRVLGYNQIALTKLDECRSFGALYDVIERSGTAVSYITNGQNVPRDIAEFSARAMARSIIDNSYH
ncbi:MAG: flagellar biosynthesis protein FlhF [Pseudomonadota bacterium]|nr:flagellar biosynthesis protein FlhF [Pseudomonadota bacterium]